ncbi:alanine racemase [Cellulomonas iranensis]|uniref:alanine racemase n=1 Tax=Cellulomonas iranensis TaxID=76862 RepID=UPI001CF2FA3F|nr:alanine racemase [Cellulomonas iranensis]UCN15278.1 alanine racemase [Cellulomonas iranensis]
MPTADAARGPAAGTDTAGADDESRVEVDLAAVRHNLRVLRTAAGQAQVMAVLKADAYGHGLLPVARTALAAGTTWFGVARASDALRLRTALRPADARVLTWLHTPGAPFARLLDADVDVSVGAPWALEEVAAAARDTGRVARVHLKVDTGMGRNGVGRDALVPLVRRAASLAATGRVEVVGLWTHLACADTPGHPATHDQVARFEDATDVLRAAGIEVPLRHVAASAATLTDPHLHYDLVRPGLATYGLSPLPPGDPRASTLTPAMTLRSRLAAVRTVPPGTPVSYGSEHRTVRRTVLGLVPLGYADGVPRHASTDGRGPARVHVNGRAARVVGRICMDQLVVDLGPRAGDAPGDAVTLFGPPGAGGVPTAAHWAASAGTITYEVVSRASAALPRTYRDDDAS